MKISIITKYSYYAIFTITILALGISFWFLYNNFYQTLTQARIVYVLKNQVAFEAVDMKLWNKITSVLKDKKKSALLTEEKLADPFVEFIEMKEE
ncbi:hypothetical protein L6278_00235 [Candidatus Parcubacteria bacterium]|nr:hypothetical protein [Patescibacteria group bacterium]MBU4482169.1 hypothetical protein [Patescibacteria group bacterium]MCG2686547.1 hypothetical protein [Candidatus Parcubacteria bacterium]